LMKSEDLVSFEVIEKETDIMVSAEKHLENQAREAVINYRRDIENYIKRNQAFLTSLEPVRVRGDAPEIVKVMAEAGKKAGVGPMAAVAGAVAEFVGRELIKFSEEIIVENGGDIFIRTGRKRSIGVYAGDKSPFTGRLAIEIGPSLDGVGICTSSGTVSHSLSFGMADAAIIISKDTSLADAVATAAGNIVKSEADIEKGIGLAKSVDGVAGALILIGDKMASWGDIKLV